MHHACTKLTYNTLALLYDSACPVLSELTLKVHELCQCIQIFSFLPSCLDRKERSKWGLLFGPEGKVKVGSPGSGDMILF